MTTSEFMAAERAANDARDRRLQDKADPDCHICHGRGRVSMHVAGDKYGDSPCTCTGEACWQSLRSEGDRGGELDRGQGYGIGPNA